MVVVVVLEVCECGLKFGSSFEDFEGKEFVSELSEETLDVAVLPGFTRLDESVLDIIGQTHGSELGSVIGDDRLRFSVDEKQPLKLFLHRIRRIRSFGSEEEAFAGENVQNAKDAGMAAAREPLEAKVKTPSLVRAGENRSFGVGNA